MAKDTVIVLEFLKQDAGLSKEQAARPFTPPGPTEVC